MNAQELDELGVRCKAFEAATSAARAPSERPESPSAEPIAVNASSH